jgi:hypothetical protein
MSYTNTGNWSWEFDPPPYSWLGPRNPAPQPAPRLLNGRIVAGMGDYQRQAYVTPQSLVDPMRDATIQIPAAWSNIPGVSAAGMGDYQRQAYVTPQTLVDPMRDATIRIPKEWGSIPPVGCPVVIPQGLGGCGCGCNGAGSCGDKHDHGLGLFDSGFDYTQWGIPEWGAVAVGGYLLLSVVGDLFTARRVVSSGYSRATAGVRRRATKKRRKAELKAELATL